MQISDSKRLRELEARWRLVAERQPGCLPHTSRRPFRAKKAEWGLTILEMLERRFPEKLSRAEWKQVFADGEIIDGEGAAVSSSQVRVGEGEQWIRLLHNWVEPKVSTDLRVLYEDDVLLVVDKPAPLPMHEAGRCYKNTFKAFAAEAWPELSLRYTHRLDAETSGVLVCVKGTKHRRAMQDQFEARSVQKTYLAEIYGRPEWDSKVINIAIPKNGRADGPIVPAESEVQILKRSEDTTLVEVSPRTGRTHQIRVHLWHEGFPLVGDTLYLRAEKRGPVAVDYEAANLLRLRAQTIRFRHPESDEEIVIAAPLPHWAS